MLANYDIIGFIPVRDLARAESFYAGQLGLQVVGNDGFALIVRSTAVGGKPGNMIRCALTPDATPQPFTILGWEVPDISAAAAELQSTGVEPKRYGFMQYDDLGIWTAPNGSKVLWFEDPDGNILSLSQHAGGTA